MPGRPRKLLLAAAELAPLAGKGGTGEAVAGLARALGRRGHDVRVLVPRYGWIDLAARGARRLGPVRVGMGGVEQAGELWTMPLDPVCAGVEVYLLEHLGFFDRPGVYGEGFGEGFGEGCGEAFGEGFGDGGGHAWADDAWRFAFLSRVALQLALDGIFVPDVVHAHDWPTALAVAYLADLRGRHGVLAGAAGVLSVHDLDRQGRFPADAWSYLGLPPESFVAERFEDCGGMNLLKGGIASADAIATVSPTHAREMQTDLGGHGLGPFLARRARDVSGIPNGVDVEAWTPETDPLLPRRYGRRDMRGKLDCKRLLQASLGLASRDDVALLGVATRLAARSGLELLRESLPPFLERGAVQLAVQGSGDAVLGRLFADLAARFPRAAALRPDGSEELRHRILGGADFLLLPALYDPGGEAAMRAMRYGALPIVRATGGLADAVEDADHAFGTGTGFAFAEPSVDALTAALRRAVETWYARPARIARLRRQAMAKRFDWDESAERYEELYSTALAGRATVGARAAAG